MTLHAGRRVDALEEADVEAPLDEVIAATGRIDVTYNAIGVPADRQGSALVDMAVADVSVSSIAPLAQHHPDRRQPRARRRRSMVSGGRA